MISLLHETSSIRPSAETRAQLAGLHSRARVLTKALIATECGELACLYRKAVRATQSDIAELEAV